MTGIFSDRISDVPKSFIREILKVAIDASVISFAGGLPNRDLFPVKALQEATNKVFETEGKDVLQYSNSEGIEDLRKYICHRYLAKKELTIPVENILVTNGSQQGLDLIAKTLLNEGDDILIEEPGYLGAIQAFSVYRSRFNPIPLHMDGIDIEILKRAVSKNHPKLIYTVPNFQNPSGISYTEENRRQAADILRGTGVVLIEDDPYGELRFSGSMKSSFKTLLPEQTILLGSFSKIVVPSFRLGWVVAPDSIMEKLIIAKQASDLHTNAFVQRITWRYLTDNNVDDHIQKIVTAYGNQRNAMIQSIQACFPDNVQYTKPEGGMFLWITLPKGLSAMTLFDLAIKDKVAFVPGDPFYVSREQMNTLRLNFSCMDEKTIETGIQRLGMAIKRLLSSSA